MNKVVGLLGMTIGGWLGWIAGAPISIFTAFIVSMVGTGLGLYLARRVTRGML